MEMFILESVLSMLRARLFSSAKLAKHAKIFLRIRDYLLMFFPVEMYPIGQTGDTLLEKAEVQPVPVSEVKKAAKAEGFTINLPFVKGR